MDCSVTVCWWLALLVGSYSVIKRKGLLAHSMLGSTLRSSGDCLETVCSWLASLVGTWRLLTLSGRMSRVMSTTMAICPLQVCGHILGGTLKDGVPAPNPTSAFEHAAAHPEKCSRPPLLRFETREERRYGSNVVKHPLRASCRTGIAGAESVLLASSLCTFRSRCVPLYSRNIGIGGGGAASIRSLAVALATLECYPLDLRV